MAQNLSRQSFLPAQWRLKIKARTEVERLIWFVQTLIDYMGTPLRPTKQVPRESAEHFVVATAWTRKALSYAHAVQLLIGHDQAEAAIPIERALLELYVEFRYLNEQGDPRENAARVQTWAAFEYCDFALARGAPPGSREELEEQFGIARRRKLYPHVVAAVENLRRKKKIHWSGMSRTQLGEKVLGPVYRPFYGVLSWDAHPVITSLRDFELMPEEDGGGLTFGHSVTGYDDHEHIASRVGTHMVAIWGTYATTFGVPLLPTSVWPRLRLVRTTVARPARRY